ncbi:hypothetical protein C0995_013745, partial [Termitomyces sp. Mi166
VTTETLSDRLLEAFDSLPNSADVRGSLSILRVLASFPSESVLTRNLAQRMGVPPVATLNATMFESVTEAIKGAEIVETLISSMQDKRNSFTDEMFTESSVLPDLEGSVVTIQETRSEVISATTFQQGEPASPRPSSRLAHRASPGSPKPYAKVRKHTSDADSLSSVEHPPSLRRRAWEHEVSSMP